MKHWPNALSRWPNCADAQVCGGYFADTGYKDVSDLHTAGYPIVEMTNDGSCTITKAAVAHHFAHRKPSCAQRFEPPLLAAMNFVLDDVLEGGVNDALNLDTHGKALSYWLPDMPIHIPHQLANLLVGGNQNATKLLGVV